MNAHRPYALKDLYQAIDRIDQKMAYDRTRETAESQADLALHLRTLSTERASLVNSALVLTNLGVRCNPRFLPRSFIHPVQDRPGYSKASPVATEEGKINGLARTQPRKS